MNKIMEEYIELHRLEKSRLYDENKKGDMILAEKINQEFDTMSRKDKLSMLSNILDDNHLDYLLLNYEMKNIKIDEKDMNIKEFIPIALGYFRRYQHRAGGYRLEDKEWLLHKHDSKCHCGFRVYKHNILFENSIDKYDFLDKSTLNYVKTLVKLLDSISNNISVSYKMIHKESGITWIYIHCVDHRLKSKNKDVKIAL